MPQSRPSSPIAAAFALLTATLAGVLVALGASLTGGRRTAVLAVGVPLILLFAIGARYGLAAGKRRA